MHAKPLDTLLLFSLPASGKSEMRRYLASLTPEQCRDDFGMGPTAQLDDYPYVHLMHRMDDELQARGCGYRFYYGATRPFQDEWTWAALIELLNEDYANLRKGAHTDTPSAAQLLFDRLDEARVRAGMLPVLDELPHRIRKSMAEALEAECRAELDTLNRQNALGIEGKTIVIEAARGGANGSAFPLTPPHGYATAFQHLSTDILDRASLMYIWVEPAQSRHKNIERGKPDGQGSILNHSVPMEVMLGQYGCDDMAYLLEQSDRPGTIRVDRLVAEGDRYSTRTWHIPASRFDNRQDLTTFVREPRENWKAADVAAIHGGLKETFRNFGR
ncbi:hypothetical protein [Mesoterricola silvestris]|uniref:Uncharacterized protein n=1 Tax=Mesoterricola silvestris TaxID=2927979 RepID=A0AA48GI22_9BACT|nr:hypothetical protein [Mesoterricola silvestris]BDU73301.1 hypothetical protein METEAL_24750 [Mesoterricola silvestris]